MYLCDLCFVAPVLTWHLAEMWNLETVLFHKLPPLLRRPRPDLSEKQKLASTPLSSPTLPIPTDTFEAPWQRRGCTSRAPTQTPRFQRVGCLHCSRTVNMVGCDRVSHLLETKDVGLGPSALQVFIVLGCRGAGPGSTGTPRSVCTGLPPIVWVTDWVETLTLWTVFWEASL